MKCRHPSGCKANALRGDDFCYFHSMRPDIVEKRKQARQRGGSRGKFHKSDSIESIADVRKIIAEIVNELRNSKGNTVSRARAIGYLLSIWVVAYEKGDIEERLSRLEERVNAT